MKRVFITGAPGWLGTRCVETLLKKEFPFQKYDYSCTCFVLRGVDASKLEIMGAKIIYGDIRDQDSLKGAMEECDCVIHMAAVVHPKRIKDMYDTNVIGTKNVLHEAILYKVKKFIYISSNSPAGFNIDGKLFSETDPPRPYMNYGRSKYLAEEFVRKAARDTPIEAIILRPCWFYGPRQPARQTRLFKMIKGGTPILFGDGGNLRSLSYVDNTVQGIILALEKEGINGQTYWIADERPYTTLEIYKAIAEMLGVKTLKPRKIPAWSSSVFGAMDLAVQAAGLYIPEIHVVGEMSRNIACSIEKAKKELGYRPQVSLREGMRRSIEWCRANGIEI
ncbi:MAG: NAD(P)-dependent oxidoreductase [Candidatus Omnitrophota bacterium]